jgi:GWxTD domain-containing protein
MRWTLLTLAAGLLFGREPDEWLVRTGPAMTGEERRLYRQLPGEPARRAFRENFWRDKAIGESEFLARSAYADGVFGSGREGSGANTDQGRVYIANGPPSSVHRLPSSRILVPCEVWYFDSLPRAGYRSRVQLLFYRKNGTGDFTLYSPQLNSIRDLLVPQPGTRSMFPVNDIVTSNAIRDRLKTSPAEEEIIEAATGVARGVTGAGNDELLSRAASILFMLRRQEGESLRPHVDSTFTPLLRPDIRMVQYRVDRIPVVEIQLRAIAAARVALIVEDRLGVVERSEIPLGLSAARQVHYTHRLFLLPGSYRVSYEADGKWSSASLKVEDDPAAGLTGEGLSVMPGDLQLAIAPDPHGADAQRAIAEQLRRRNQADTRAAVNSAAIAP